MTRLKAHFSDGAVNAACKRLRGTGLVVASRSDLWNTRCGAAESETLYLWRQGKRSTRHKLHNVFSLTVHCRHNITFQANVFLSRSVSSLVSKAFVIFRYYNLNTVSIEKNVEFLFEIYLYAVKAKQFRYTPWWRLGGEEV
jgi:hypothetical protein